VSAAEADAYIHQLSETTADTLEDGGEVQLYHFGRFVTVHVDERPGQNPRTNEAITIPEHTRVDFRPYQALLASVNWPFRHLRTKMLSENKTDSRPGALIWLLLLLALLALILIGFSINSWMSNRSSDLANPVAISASMEPSTIQPDPVVSSKAPVLLEEPVPVEEDASKLAGITPAESAAATTRSIVVVSGDTLWRIAISHWGDSSWWPVIYVENRAGLTSRNPDLIKVGSTLRLPILAGGVAQPTNADLRQKTNAYSTVADDYARISVIKSDEYRVVAARGFGSIQE
jgi:nucleoid DNA-binding protein